MDTHLLAWFRSGVNQSINKSINVRTLMGTNKSVGRSVQPQINNAFVSSRIVLY
jgi:hypothetical protein